MAMGSGSASQVVAFGLLVMLCFVMHGELAESATTYTVGDSGGWTFSSGSWPSGKRFKAGDCSSTIRRYTTLFAVNAAGYKSCKVPRGSKTYTSGSDSITLARGTNYFICSFAGHCQSGMKIAVTAA
uniref:Plantacyanin n=1 Tax=Ananas comosus var. bracteatus TaxID=296719 RepID=A0A6V7Q3N9_ANACO|nr:unnamed protein product [Ananas comosus var. bracteatus]